jgi:class 3 adenylate cyclase/CheY-like chemotaxis protein
MSILIVDDSASQRLVLTAHLRAVGYTDLLPVASAQEAFDRLGLAVPESPPPGIDLVLMDVSMPEIDGITACHRIKAADHLRDIPIIMVTASTEDADLEAAFAAGAMDYLTKPVNRVQLLPRVRSALRLKQEMDRRKAREQELLAVTLELTRTNAQLEETLVTLAQERVLLEQEQARSEQLLLNILPSSIAERLKRDQGVIAESYPDVTVLFADIVDFTPLSARITPHELVTLLDETFSTFDHLAEKHGLEKIKTIGDAYMVVGGLPTPRPDHAQAVAEMALDMRAALTTDFGTHGELLTLRIGIHTGPVVAGVIGRKKFIYDLWGDTVNIASRMESHGFQGSIQVTAETYTRLYTEYNLVERGKLNVKGKGEMMTYLLLDRKPPGVGV